MLRNRVITKFWIQIIIISVLYHSCQKVSRLSDGCYISDIEFISVSPELVVLEKPVIEHESITIPVKVGKYLFPIEVVLRIDSPDDIKILWPKGSEKIRFEDSNSINIISIVAQSGLVTKYEVKLKLLPSEEMSEIIGFDWDTINDANIGKRAYIDPINSTITLYGIEPKFPIVIAPKFDLSPKASLLGWSDNKVLTFSELNKTERVSVLSESGRIVEWSISIKNVDYIDNIDALHYDSDVKKSIVSRLSHPFYNVDIGIDDDHIKIDSVLVFPFNRVIKVLYSGDLKEGEINLNIDATLKDHIDYCYLDSEIFFIDNIYGIAAKWQVILQQSFDYYEIVRVNSVALTDGYGIEIIPEVTKIVPQEKSIIFSIPSGWIAPLRLSNLSFMLNDGNVIDMEPSSLFNSFEDIRYIDVRHNGFEERWAVKLKNIDSQLSDKAEVLDFKVTKASFPYSVDEIYIEPDDNQIIILSERFQEGISLKIAPQIKVSPGAQLDGVASGGVLEIPWNQEVGFNVVAQNGSSVRWSIKLIYAPQIINWDMEGWGAHPLFNSVATTILPSDGSGWNSSNNPSVTGVERAPGYNSTSAAKIETTLSTINFADLVKVSSLTSATLFLGRFKYSTNTADVYNPGNMTIFGIPFKLVSIPKKLTFAYKYVSGPKLIKTSPILSSTLLPAFSPVEELQGRDTGRAWVELWSNSRDMLIGSGELIMSNDVLNWSLAEISVIENELYSGSSSDFISIGFTSSRLGEEFIGASGSTLIVDNVRLLYHIPGKNSIKIK